LTKITSRFIVETHFFLFNDILIYAYENRTPGTYTLKGKIDMGTTWIRDLPDSQRTQQYITSLFSFLSFIRFLSEWLDSNLFFISFEEYLPNCCNEEDIHSLRSNFTIESNWLIRYNISFVFFSILSTVFICFFPF
jgi:hypothetical protein